VLNTVGAFLVVSLASPVYDLARLRNTQAAEPGSRLQWNSRCPYNTAADKPLHTSNTAGTAKTCTFRRSNFCARLVRYPCLTTNGHCVGSEAEANAYLAMVMILAALLLMVLIRRLGLALVEIEQSRVSHGAVLKQVPAWLAGQPVWDALYCRCLDGACLPGPTDHSRQKSAVLLQWPLPCTVFTPLFRTLSPACHPVVASAV
jgi:hypothetical protein